jgi:hypothetical protein
VLARAKRDDAALEVRRVARLREPPAAQVDRVDDVHVHIAARAIAKRLCKLLKR